MTRRMVLTLAIAAMCGTRTSHADNGAVALVRPVAGIKVDGDLRDWPAEVVTLPIAHFDYGDKTSGTGDLSARMRLGYSRGERALFVAVEVEDDSSVVDGSTTARWDSEDGCELYVQTGRAVPVAQFCRYGDKTVIHGIESQVGPGVRAGAGKKPEVQVVGVRQGSKLVYEWRLDLGKELKAGQSMGLDVSVTDRDKDGSFSWAAWGPGTQKISMPDRRGTILLVDGGTRMGEVSGKVVWEDESKRPLPDRVWIESGSGESFWIDAKVDVTGGYRATLPFGTYQIHAVDSLEVRVKPTPVVTVTVEAESGSRAELLRVSPVPWPGLIGKTGVLSQEGSLDTGLVDRFANAYLKYYQIPGISIAVIKDGKVAYRRGLGVRNATTGEPVTEETVFEAASMTKPVLGYLTMRMKERGVLALDTPLYQYLPYPDIAHDDRYKLITARMVLTHRTGFPNWRSGKLEIKFTPGTDVSYSGEGFVYLGMVIEKLTGKTLVELCQAEVFEPLGVENAYLVWNDRVAKETATGHAGMTPLQKGRPDQPNMAASLHIDAGNYAKFLIGVTSGQGLKETTIREMLRPQVKVPEEEGYSFGLGIFVEETPFGVNYGHGGRNSGFTSHSAMYLKQGVGYVFLVNNDEARRFDRVLRAFLITGLAGMKELPKGS